jgi:type II secretion system protein H
MTSGLIDLELRDWGSPVCHAAGEGGFLMSPQRIGKSGGAVPQAGGSAAPLGFRVNSRWQRRAQAGFTIMEIIVVMAIVIMMLGIASFALRQASPDPSVREPADELIQLAKTAVRASALQGRGFAVAFDKQGFALTGADSGQRSRAAVPKGMKVHIKRWGGRQWEEAEGYRWWFGAQGLCEPLEVRLAAKDSMIVMKFNPLTGTPSEEVLETY